MNTDFDFFFVKINIFFYEKQTKNNKLDKNLN